MTAMVNDGLRSVHGMQEQLGFHCWKAHWSLLSILQFHVPLRQWLPVILTLTSQGRRQSWLLLPHWTEACPFGSDVVVARRHLFFWLVIIFFTGWLRCLWEKIQANADQILGKKDMNDVTEALCLSLSLLCLLIKLNLNWCRRTCLSPCTRQWRASCARYSHGLIVANHSSAPCENHDLVSQPFMESVSDCEWQCHRTQFSMQCHFHWGMDATGKVSVLMKGFLLETDDSMEMCQWGAGVVFQVNCLQISACNDSLS